MDTVLVKIKHGELRGKLQNNYKNRTFYSFFGIPYATPPLGNLRFKPPQPLKPWKGILDVTEEKEGCIAPNTYTRKLEGSEDCLHLNVYTPEVNTGKTKLKPVIVFIHGGAFLIGNTKTEIYGPEFLLTEDVVLVLISYRLGALGWSRLEDGSLGIPGNQGLRDIIMGLNWVQRNIESFSGNPNNVTLFGESTGALLAHILMFVPSCEGLFHKIILHSTLGILHSAFGQNDFMKKLAKRLGHSSESDKDILEFLQKQPIEKIIQRQMIYKSSLIANVERPFYPVFENDDNIEEKITFTDYKERIKKGEYIKVPMIVGYTADEGLFFDYSIRRKLKRNQNLISIRDFEDMIPLKLGFKKRSPESLKIAEKTKIFYFNERNPTYPKDRKQFYRMYTERLGCLIQDTAVKHFKTLQNPIYFFKFAFDGQLNLYKKLQGVDFPGASHSDELCYLFKMSKNPPVEENSYEDKTIQRMVKLWTNFARNGNPNNLDDENALINIEWKPIEKDKLHFINIGDELTVGINPDKEGTDFWDEVFNMKSISKL
ncbi:juvenile hormone esterase-like [Onthophagus taurus]|uniref:juvenile hormone esterase-like n=1 Tax=Onthophagus taurus TaxID=166361 RepID=UPI0039BE0FC2